MACTIAVVREGLQGSSVRIFQVLRVATARSPRQRIRAWALFTPSAGATAYGCRSSRTNSADDAQPFRCLAGHIRQE